MRKLILLISLFSLTFAGQFAGLIIDESTGKGLEAELLINGQEVAIAPDGRYQAEAADQQPNHYLLELENGGAYLFATNRNDLNLQMAAARPIQPGRNGLWADIDITLFAENQLVEKADVQILTILKEINKSFIMTNEVRDYNHGQSRFKYLQPTDTMYALVSRNNELYVQKLENIVPGKTHGLALELSEFSAAGEISGAAYRDGAGYLQIVNLPTANNYYLHENVLPVYAGQLEGYTLLYFGRTPQFPDTLEYYNIRELVYDSPDGLLTVYTDLKIENLDVSQYGKYELLLSKGYHLDNFSLRNFSPAMLRDVKEAFVRTKTPAESENSEND